MRRRYKKRRITGNSVIHVPATIAGNLAANVAQVFVIVSPSIFAAGSASSNIEAQDKDRTVNVGHHIGSLNLSLTGRQPAQAGVVEFCLLKVERADSTPAIGTHPVSSTAENIAQGMQQVCRMANPGKVFHYSKRAYTTEIAFVHNIRVSPAKFRLSKVKAGDHWILIAMNRDVAGGLTFDFEARYKEYE